MRSLGGIRGIVSDIDDILADGANPGRPHSVSVKAWPSLKAIGEERKTRIFAESGTLQVAYGLGLEHDAVTVFNRISDAQPGGVFTAGSDPRGAQYVRHGHGIGAFWFDVRNPATIHYNDVLRPLDVANLVFVAPQTYLDVREMRDVASFEAESLMIEKTRKLIDANAGVHLRASFTQVAHALGMPRLKAVAEQYERPRYPGQRQAPRLRDGSGAQPVVHAELLARLKQEL